MASLGFWGGICKPGKELAIAPQTGLVLRISSAALANATKNATVSIVADGKTTIIAHLSPTHPHTALDIFFVGGNKVSFSVTGKCSVHFAGYTTLMEANADSSDEEETAPTKAQTTAPKIASKAAKAAAAPVEEEDDEDSDSDFEMPQAPVDDDSDSEDDEESDEEEEDAAPPTIPAQASASEESDEEESSEEEAPVPAKQQSKKRKAEPTPTTPSAKKAKQAQTPKAKSSKKGAATPGKTVKCRGAGCPRMFSDKAGMEQHASAKHSTA